MPNVTCIQKTSGFVVIAKCWIVRGGSHTVLTREGVNLPKGKYELHWEFRADVGGTFIATLNMPSVVTSQPCTTGPQTIAHGQTNIGSGSDKPPGYTALCFQV
jgi:hypothetical protein